MKSKLYKKTDIGYVYALKDGARNGIKIGSTYSNPHERCIKFNASEKRKGRSNGFKVVFVGMVRPHDKIEKIVHELIKPCRITGEHFTITIKEFELIIKYNFRNKEKDYWKKLIAAMNGLKLGI